MMELLIKLYIDKPSRVAIKYDSDLKALPPYQDLITKFKGHSFHITVEVRDKK